jgi:hypothetical protein
MPKKRSDGAAGRKSVRCHTCGKRIRIPEGWTAGPAVRRHYWKQHRERMQKPAEGSR